MSSTVWAGATLDWRFHEQKQNKQDSAGPHSVNTKQQNTTTARLTDYVLCKYKSVYKTGKVQGTNEIDVLKLKAVVFILFYF